MPVRPVPGVDGRGRQAQNGGSLARNTSFDEQPRPEVNSEAIDFRAASEFFPEQGHPLTRPKLKSLGLMVDHQGRDVPTNGAVLLFGRSRSNLFPQATVRCARFAGIDRERIIDQTEIDEYLPKAVESTIAFVQRHTRQEAIVGPVRRRDVPEYPPVVVREGVVNAIVHTDYAIRGAGTQVAIFDNRVEITNPGPLPFGLTMEAAMSGVSKLGVWGRWCKSILSGWSGRGRESNHGPVTVRTS